ncbi:hypothetical protein [Nocardia terpenica]|uniref:Uncharacterized protein n=1 Tax=Nocardia terpenica TaxID=455432 RepID=A0A161X775_9NOCA|nr:hypothetical protein [Nocardia terpenica]KZM68868.1 hypothetical protein AWN90_13860 [Nocardia terpenica]NQE88086.1 hypothetical protein [Nocardia terpenica]
MGFPDPFSGAAAASEAQDAQPASGGSVFDTPPAQAVKAERPVAAGDGKVVLTFKGGAGYDAPWVVIHAADLADAYDQVSGENSTLLASLMKEVQAGGQFFSSLGSSAPKGGSGGGGGQRQQRAPQESAPGGQSRQCSHGEMVFKSGVGKNGKPWKAFMCPAPRNAPDQCDPDFLR